MVSHAPDGVQCPQCGGTEFTTVWQTNGTSLGNQI
jgi:hypothetical protein